MVGGTLTHGAESPASGARFVGQLFVINDLMVETYL
jgi:hypothetical protein